MWQEWFKEYEKIKEQGKNNIYNCKRFKMYNISLSTLFRKSPKISYICGKCNEYNETRIPVRAIELDRPHAQCKTCGAINKIPIKIEE